MDACAVSICKGLACREQNWRHNLLAGLYFGGFQGLMPVIGYLVGVNFSSAISSIDHWVAFVLLGLIGGNMIRLTFRQGNFRTRSGGSGGSLYEHKFLL